MYRYTVLAIGIQLSVTKCCMQGKVKSKTDFKHLARKLTHLIVEKEQRRLLMKANKKGHHGKFFCGLFLSHWNSYGFPSPCLADLVCS